MANEIREALTLYIGMSSNVRRRHSNHEAHDSVAYTWDAVGRDAVLCLEVWECAPGESPERGEAWLRDVYGYGRWNNKPIEGAAQKPSGACVVYLGHDAMSGKVTRGAGVYRWSIFRRGETSEAVSAALEAKLEADKQAAVARLHWGAAS